MNEHSDIIFFLRFSTELKGNLVYKEGDSSDLPRTGREHERNFMIIMKHDQHVRVTSTKTVTKRRSCAEL